MVLAFLSSVFLIAALPPYDFWPLAWVGLVPLLLALVGTTPREAATLGALSGAATNYMAFHWTLELMDKFSNLGPAAYLCMLLMACYQAIPWALWCYFLRADGPSEAGTLRAWGGVLLSCLSFVALEFFFPIIFPWYLANTQHTRAELTSIVSFGGVSALSLAIVVVNLAVAHLLAAGVREKRVTLWPSPLVSRLPRPLWALGGLVPVLLLGYHLLVKSEIDEAIASAPKFAVGLVQPNEWIGQGPAIEGLHDYQKMTYELVEKCRRDGLSLDLVLWPESAVRTPPPSLERASADSQSPARLGQSGRLLRFPLDVSRVYPALTVPAASLAEERGVDREDLLAIQRGHSVPILFGTTLEDLDPQAKGAIPGRAPLYNCGVLLGEAGEILGAVKKVKLLMFGETIPGARYFPDIYRLLPAASSLLPGEEADVITMGEARLGIMICYEDLLPWFHYQLAQKKPQVLLNLTNDAWFGKTAEPYCHMALSTLRAVEGRCYLIRSTPTGMSVVIDPYGQIVASIASDQVGSLREEIALLDITTGFERWGDSLAWLSLIYLVLFGGAWWGKGRQSSANV